MAAQNPHELLKQFEDILGFDPLIDEVGFIHPSQFAALDEDAGASLSSSGTVSVRFSETVYWCRDHKLGISTEILRPLYDAAKHSFMSALERYKMHTGETGNKSDIGSDDMSLPSSLDILETEVMKHSKALLLLSCDFGTAWNSRKLVLSDKQQLQMFFEELSVTSLVLSYAPKSERSWSHRRWVIQMITGRCSNLQEILEMESEIVKRIAEKSKMNYRAWYHRCWLVSYMSHKQILHELNSSRDWTGLHVADNSCFHYRVRLMLRLLEESSEKKELRLVWKEELDWNEILIKRYKGREALWLHRRFLSFGWIEHFLNDTRDHQAPINHDISLFVDTELELVRSSSIITVDDFEDFQADAVFSATYILWLTKQMSVVLEKETRQRLPMEEMKTVLSKFCPEKMSLWNSLQSIPEHMK